MRVNYYCLGLVISLLFSVQLVQAQSDKQYTKNQKDSILNEITDINKRLKIVSVKDTTNGYSVRQFVDSVINHYAHTQPSIAPRDSQGLLIVPSLWVPFDNNTTFRDTVIFQPAFLPVAFNGKILPHDLDFLPKDSSTSQFKQFHLIDPDSTFTPQLANVRKVEELRKMYYTENPMRIKINGLGFDNSPVIKEQVVEKKSIFQDLLSTDNAISISTPDVDKIEIRPVFWIKEGKHELQISQNAFSENWGSDNNFVFYSNHVVKLNYKKKKISFNNQIEWRLNLQQVSIKEEERADADKKSYMNVIDDYIRSYSTFGVDAYKKWSYSTNLELKTPLFNKFDTYKPGRVKTRALFSPFELNWGLGMRYANEVISKQDKYRKFNISADISALSVNYKFIGDNGVSRSANGIEGDKKSNTDLGSSFNINLSYSRNRYTNFTSRIKYFTSYDKVYLECENSFNFALNRYLATTLYLYIKYDDSVDPSTKDGDIGYFKYNEMLRFGLSYTW